MAAKRKTEAWYAKYLRAQVRRIFQWSPSRKAAKKRAQVARNPEAYQCEECGAQPLRKGMYEVDHIHPCENVHGFDGWGPFIERALGVTAEGLRILCKPCHYKKSAAENRIRRTVKEVPGREHAKKSTDSKSD